MNLNVLAKRIGVTQHELFRMLDQHGIRVRRGVNKLSDKKAKEFIKKVEKDRISREEAVRRAEEERKRGLPEEIFIPETIKVKDLAVKMTLSLAEVIKKLMQNGVMATLNEEVDYETASIIADEYGIKAHPEEKKGAEAEKEKGVRKQLQEEMSGATAKNKHGLKNRPPIVTILGHVDHGKTTLLDAIRKTKVAAGESGGITQHIGAYQVKYDGKLITFLDTPGHEAFSAMRERGARVTDVAILVVAADDGVQPQTIEAIAFIKNAGVPVIVAINKMDKEGADPLRVKKDLATHDILTEEWGGKTICVEIAAKTGKNLEELLETILLVAEVEELKADPEAPAVGTIIESHVDSGQGVVATVLVQNGTLHKGDPLTIGPILGSIRTMENDQGKRIDHAKPSAPVQITGLPEPPQVGDILQAFASKTEAKERIAQLAKLYISKGRAKSANGEIDERKRFNVILKTDVQGSIEPLMEALNKIPTDEVTYEIVNAGVGSITESDVLMASSTNAAIYGFTVPIPSAVKKFADNEKVEAKSFDIIYELVEDVRARLETMLEVEKVRTKIGVLDILAVFRVEKRKRRLIVGGRVMEGSLSNGAKVQIVRNENGKQVEIGKGEIANLQKNKVNVKELNTGAEGGLQLITDAKIQENDKLVAWKEEKKRRELKLKG